jgi:ABC-type transport system substrate-binding protein
VRVRFAYRATRRHEVDVLTRQWEPLFAVEPLPFDDVDGLTSLDGEFDLFLASGFDGFDPALDWRDLALGASSDDVGQGVLTGNAIVDRLLVQQWQTDDVAQRAQAWSSIVGELQQTGRALFLSHSASVLATQPWVRGVTDATTADGTALQHQVGPEHWFGDLWLAEQP